MILTVTLTDYGISKPFPFDVDIGACILESIEFDEQLPQETYKVGETALKIPLPTVI